MLHEPGDIWLQYIPIILRTWKSIDIAQDFDPPYNQSWQEHIEDLREDDHYDEVVKSLLTKGWCRPVTCAYTSYSGLGDTKPRWYYGDGHHRLAVAIDLGAKYIPVHRTVKPLVDQDSGTWGTSYGGKRIARSRSNKFLSLEIPPFKVKV